MSLQYFGIIFFSSILIIVIPLGLTLLLVFSCWYSCRCLAAMLVVWWGGSVYVFIFSVLFHGFPSLSLVGGGCVLVVSCLECLLWFLSGVPRYFCNGLCLACLFGIACWYLGPLGDLVARSGSFQVVSKLINDGFFFLCFGCNLAISCWFWAACWGLIYLLFLIYVSTIFCFGGALVMNELCSLCFKIVPWGVSVFFELCRPGLRLNFGGTWEVSKLCVVVFEISYNVAFMVSN